MEELIFIFRNLINDPDGATYSDSNLLDLLCVAAFLVISETPFIEGYIVNLKDKQITPDPTYATSADVPFMSLITLRGAYMVLNNEAKTYAKRNVKIVDGPSQIDIKDQWAALAALAKARKEEYDNLKNKLTLEYNGGNGLVVMSPTTVQTIMESYWR